MSTTQELITPAALNYIANETACQLDDPLHTERLRTLIPEALRQAAARLSELSAELDALRGKLAGVVRFAEHIAKQPLAEQARKDHEDEGHDGEPDFEGAYDAIIEQARAAIAAYLAAVGG